MDYISSAQQVLFVLYKLTWMRYSKARLAQGFRLSRIIQD